MTVMSMKLLEGERALITGCAGGIGRGIAKALKAEGALVLLRRDAASLCPLDLAGEVHGRAVAVGLVQRLGDVTQDRHLGGEDARGGLVGEAAQLGERRRVEGARHDAVRAERRQAVLQLARRLLGEGDGGD